MTYDKAKDRKNAKDRAEYDLVVAQELAKLANRHVPFSVAALIAGTTPGNIAQVVAMKLVAGSRSRRTCSLTSLEAWMATRPKKSTNTRPADPPNE